MATRLQGNKQRKDWQTPVLSLSHLLSHLSHVTRALFTSRDDGFATVAGREDDAPGILSHTTASKGIGCFAVALIRFSPAYRVFCLSRSAFFSAFNACLDAFLSSFSRACCSLACLLFHFFEGMTRATDPVKTRSQSNTTIRFWKFFSVIAMTFVLYPIKSNFNSVGSSSTGMQKRPLPSV